MSILMCCAYLTAWTPYAVLALCYMSGVNSVPRPMSVAAPLFAKSCSCYNPLVYFLSVRQFRKDAHEVFREVARRLLGKNGNSMELMTLNRRCRVEEIKRETSGISRGESSNCM